MKNRKAYFLFVGTLIPCLIAFAFLMFETNPFTDYTHDGQDTMPENSGTVSLDVSYVKPDPARFGHPRVFVNKEDIEGIRAGISLKDNYKAYERVKAEARKQPDGTRFDKDALIIQSNAFLYLVDNSEQSGRKAIDEFLKYCANTGALKTKIKDSYSRAMTAGNLMATGAMVYDWCYSQADDKERQQMADALVKLAAYLETGYPPTKLSSIVSHGSGNQILYFLLSAGIAIYDENQEMFNYASDRIYKEFVPARKFVYASGMHYQGNNYGQDRYEAEILATLLFDKIGVKNVFGEKQKEIPYQWVYSRRPDGQLLRDGDTYINYLPGVRWTFIKPNLYSASYFKDPFIQNELKKDDDYWNTNPNYIKTGSKPIPDIFRLIFWKDERESKSNENLPLTRFFGSPIGSMTARTGWNDGKNSNDVIASFKIGEYQFNNHLHLDAGSFQIFHRGALAIDSGVYEGVKGGYGSDHDINYHKRTIAHNAMLVYDPSEKFQRGIKGLENDGGQRLPNNGLEPRNMSDIMKGGYETGKVLYYGFGPDKDKPVYSYLSGDLTKAYSSKVSKYVRSFLFINNQSTSIPATIIVFDRVTASKDEYDKYYLLHSIQKPEVNNNMTSVPRTEDGYNGKLVNITLLPESPNIELVGGENNEFNVFDRNYPNFLNTVDRNKAYEAGKWRVQISAKDHQRTQNFLNVMYVMDSKYNASNNTVLYSNGGIVGVIMDNGYCFFNKESEQRSEKIEIKITENIQSNQAAQKMYIFTDMKEGKWTVYKEDKMLYKDLLVDDKSGILFFYGTPGSYNMVKSK